MREILFRGKRTDNGEWIEGDCVHSVYRIGDTCVGKYGNKQGMHQVDPETVGQYIGLTDKNGKKIFEGDIVRPSYAYEGSGGVVSYGAFNCSCCEGVNGWCFGAEDIREYDSYVVIGNIHDNPELLGGE